MNRLLQALALFGFVIAALFFKLVVLTKLWGYVAVPMGAQPLSMMQALGFSMMVSLIASKAEDSHKKTGDEATEEAIKQVVFSFINSAVAWGLGYWIFG